MTAKSSAFSDWKIITVVTLFVGVWLVVLLTGYGWTEDSMRIVLRFTGRVSFPVFLLTFNAKSFHSLWRNSLTEWMVRNRRALGLAFTVVYLYHAIGFIGLTYITGNPGIEGIEMVLSILAYGFLTAMTITSMSAIARRMSLEAWQFVHTTGMFTFWYFFVQEYLHKFEETGSIYYATLASITGLSLVLWIAGKTLGNRRTRRSEVNL
jgi:DMSO/TMAO reductase YedYZ heme-binding membrane subunit